MALVINGTTGISGLDGSSSSPVIQGTDSNTGISFGTDIVNVNTAGNQRLKINDTGIITAPYQAAFTAWSSVNSFSLASGGKVPFNEVGTGFGNFTPRDTHGGTDFYSTTNRRYTAPVTGLYFFNVAIYFHATNNNNLCSIVPRINGNQISNGNNTIFFISANGHSEGHTPNGSLLLQLSAGDYIEIYRRTGQSGTNSCYGSHSHFQGFLVG